MEETLKGTIQIKEKEDTAAIINGIQFYRVRM